MSRTGATRTSTPRVRAAPGYNVRIGGDAGASEQIGLDADGDRGAVTTAFGACSTFGHSLWHGRRFVGWFEPGESRIPGEWRMREAIAAAPSGRPQ